MGFEPIRHLSRSETCTGSRTFEAIEGQIAIFRAEVESLGEGDYPEAERPVRRDPFSWISATGRESVK